MQKIFSISFKISRYSVKPHGKDAEEKLVVSDTTVQENNTSGKTNGMDFMFDGVVFMLD